MGAQGLSSRAIKGDFYQTLEAVEAESWVSRIAMGPFPSDQESETYKWLGMTPALSEWVGGRQPKGFRENGITIENKIYEATLEVLKDEIRRDKTGQIRVRIGELADRAVEHWGKLVSTLILNGESTACYDGQFFFDTDHSEGASGTQSNDITNTDYSELAVVASTNPTAKELADVIVKMVQHLYGIVDDQGEPMNAGARAFHVHVPVPYWGNAAKAISGELLATGSGTFDNPLLALQRQKQGITFDLYADPRSTWTTKLAVFRTDGRAKPFIRQEEVPIDMAAIAEGSEEELKNRRWLFMVEAIRNCGYGLWQHGVLGTLTDAA